MNSCLHNPSLKTTILLFSIVVLSYPILIAEAVDKTQATSDCIQSSECTTQSFIIEKQDKQIANLTDQVIGLKNTANSDFIIKTVGVIFGIAGTLYGIKTKRALSKLQAKTEKAKEKTERAKTKSYQAKAEAEEARKAEHTTGALKNLKDLFFGNKPRN